MPLKAQYDKNHNSNALKRGDISPLVGRGPIAGIQSDDIGYDFEVTRFDEYQFSSPSEFNPRAIRESENQRDPSKEKQYPFADRIKTWTGANITQSGSGPNIFAGNYWLTNSLSKNISCVYLRNGRSGTIGLKFDLQDVREGEPIIFTCGKLSGCTAIFSIDNQNQYLYALHTGKDDVGGHWATATEGVDSTAHALTRLLGRAYPPNIRPGNYGLVDLFSNKFNKTTITYCGKQGMKAFGVNNNNIKLFDYDKNYPGTNKYTVRLGLSYCLVTRHHGKVIVKTYSEDDELIIIPNGKAKIKKLASLEHTLL